MDYRDERETLRARVEMLEGELRRAAATIAELRGERRSRRAGMAKRVALAGGLVLMMAAFVVYVRRLASSSTTARQASALQKGEAPTAPRFNPGPGPPMFAPIDTDLVLDPILWGTSERKPCLAGFDGRSGTRLWLNCSHRKEITIDRRSAVVGGRLIVGFERFLEAFDVKSGAALWTTAIDDDEPLEFHCLSPDGTLRIVLKGAYHTYVVHAETGELEASTLTYDCQVIWNDYERGVPGRHGESVAPGALPKVAGMRVERGVAYGGRTFALGYRNSRPRVPMAAAVDQQGALLWRRPLPSDDPELTDTSGPIHEALDDSRLCASYWGHDGLRLGCWDAATGKTLWDDLASLDAPIVLIDDHVFLSAYSQMDGAGRLTALNLASGKRLYDIP
jgi:outer membrane protein assembly factor BamB